MQIPTRWRWYFPWVPLGLAAVVLGVVMISLRGHTPLESPRPAPKPVAQQQQSAPTVSACVTNDKLVLAVHAPTGPDAAPVVVELVDPAGKVLSESQQAAAVGGNRFEMAQPKIANNLVTIRCRAGEAKSETILTSVLLAKPHETTLAAGKELFAGSRAGLRCVVRGVHSLDEMIAHPDALVEVSISTAGKESTILYSGRTNSDGVADIRFDVPKLAAGSYKLAVLTRSPLGEERLEQDVNVKTAPKVLLVADKPLYQPGQTMHLRALCLNGFDLQPVAETAVVFEVADGKGNKVFKKALTTSAYGVVATDFTLADEVNQGDYRIRALLGEQVTEKVVSVRPYSLPKFKAAIEMDKKYYQPGETAKVTLQADYFFQKPVARGKVKVDVSTFDVQFTSFAKQELTTDDKGTVKFEVKLPDKLVGQPLNQGNAMVRFEVKVTDGADHTETFSKMVPVSDRPIQVNLLPEGGRLIPGLENRLFVAAIYPDGTPATADVVLWQGAKPQSESWVSRIAGPKPLARVRTTATGLAEIKITPEATAFRATEWKERPIEMLGGRTVQTWAPGSVYDISAVARDANGNTAVAAVMLSSEPLGENLLLRMDKAIYRGGDTLKAEVLSNVGGRTVYFDIVRSGQTLLTRWLDVKDGKAATTIDLEPNLAGTLEIHAYQVLRSGEVIRDSRVVYVQTTDDLRVAIDPDKGQYRPGEKGKVRFTVTDAAGKPAQAALGIVVVDEAVYALQDMQPGLEKVFFTLQEELLKPQVSIPYHPTERLDVLAMQPQLDAPKQQIAEALLTAVRPKAPARWDVNPAEDRRLRDEQTTQQIGMNLYQYAVAHEFLAADKISFKTDLLKDVKKITGTDFAAIKDSLGNAIALEDLVRREPGFQPSNLARAVTWSRLQNAQQALMQVAHAHAAEWIKDSKWTVPADALSKAGAGANLVDGWGRAFRVVKRQNAREASPNVLDVYEVVSAGPDGKMDTADDIHIMPPGLQQFAPYWWMTTDEMQHLTLQLRDPRFQRQGRGGMRNRGAWGEQGEMDDALRANMRAGAMPLAARALGEKGDAEFDKKADGRPGIDAVGQAGGIGGGTGAAAAPPVKVREYFPETLLWQPALITDADGKAELTVPFADSITTWRMTASASSRGGSLGGVTLPLRVFQDFFIDIDLPRTLTQDDEVTFPVAIYNYLDHAQKITLELTKDDSFELIDGLGYSRAVEAPVKEVTNVKFRIRAKKLGRLSLKVEAKGSDAVIRTVDVVPNGQLVEQAATDRLAGKPDGIFKVSHDFPMPANAVPDAGHLYVKVYPGVFSQVMEGADGILRMPGGCFEQTSSSAYPNILAVAYMKKTKTANPAIMLKAETVLQAGYQRLLTFEGKNGGFDWWGQGGEPLIWLSAYGLNEFNDMSQVMEIDRAVITRTQKWLISQQAADGTWSKIGATHGESIERMGDSKLLLTSYVTWALLESGYKGPETKKALDFIRARVKDEKNAYILALAANALAADDAQDDATHDVLKKLLERLNEQKTLTSDKKAAMFPIVGGQSLSYARGDGMTVETTALAVLALNKNGQFPDSVNQCLTYLINARDPHGTWGSTQATILALKALTTCSGPPPQKGTADVVVLVNGKQADTFKITEQDGDVMRTIDLTHAMNQAGANNVTLEVTGPTMLAYQVVSRHYEPWAKDKPSAKPAFDVAVTYDRKELATTDTLHATATLKFNGEQPAAMVMLELGIPPGFNVDAGEFAEMVGKKQVNKFSVTSSKVTLYLSDVKPGQELKFTYPLKARYPIKAKTPETVAYEYYTPTNRGVAAPTELVVEEGK